MSSVLRHKRWALLATAILIIIPLILSLRLVSLGKISYMKPIFVCEVTDDRELVGMTHNVFIGKVIAKNGDKRVMNHVPETQFKVLVVTNIKGSLDGEVIVDQVGGVLNNETILYEGDKLIEPGKVYLFATRFLESENWHTLVPIYGRLEISGDKVQANLIERFQKAYAEQIIRFPDR